MNGGMAIRPRLLLLAALLAAGARPVGAAPAPAAVIDQRLAADYPSLFALYQDFHAHPELSLKEEKTAARLAAELRRAGFDVTEHFGGTGVEDSGQLFETWVQYSGLRPLHVRVGAFAPSIGLDDQASTNGMAFLERAGVEDIVRGTKGACR